MKNSFWIIIVVVAILAFLVGYSLASRDAATTTDVAGAGAGAPTGGYGMAPTGGYGAPAGGYGAPAGGYGAAPTGAYWATPTGGYGSGKKR